MWTLTFTGARRGRVLAAVPLAFGCLLAAAACDTLTEPEPRLTPDAILAQLEGTDGETYTRVETTVGEDGEEQTAQGLIGRRGGVLRLGSHYVVVPWGAVVQPTVFSMSLAADGLLQFDLHATRRAGRSGRSVQFRGPVYLVLDYGEATNLDGVDPKRLQVLYEPDDGGPAEPVRTFTSRRSSIVVGQLEHFSRYCLAYN